MPSPPAIALIGSPWALTLLHSCLPKHLASIDYYTLPQLCFYDQFVPLSLEALTCHSQQSYGLPLHKTQSSWRLWGRVKEMRAFPTIGALQALWPKHVAPGSHHYLLNDSCTDRSSFYSLPSLDCITKAHDGLWKLDQAVYQGIVLFTPLAEEIPAALASSFPDFPDSKPLYCTKSGSDLSLPTSLSFEPPKEGQTIRWDIWEGERWSEKWDGDKGSAIWAIQTPVCIEKFLNQKQFLESFMKKISFHARQRSIRVR